MPINLIKTCEQLTEFVGRCRQQRQTIGVVPTMGALHVGHISLVRASVDRCDATIVTIFVNPTQFAPGEDLDAYPRTLEADMQRLQQYGDITVFAPEASEVYPPDATTMLVPPTVAKKLEGEFRPTHFAGVATIVLKIFNMTQADVAFFGQKDFQQVAVVRQMVKDLNVPVEVAVCPIVRDDDGLALSSRNAYLSPDQRQVALSINRTLDAAEVEIRGGLTDGFEVITAMRQALIDGGVDTIDYAVIADPVTLETQDPIELPAVALIAVHVGKTRLIDNRLVGE